VRIKGEGGEGWGEAAPYPGQDESIERLLDAAREGTATTTLGAAIDEALSDLGARTRAEPLLTAGAPTLSMCVAVGIGRASETIDSLVEQGIARFKIKVAPGAIEHLLAVRHRHPGIVIGIDGNGSFGDLDRYDLGILHDVGLAFAEELFAEWVTGGAEMFTEMTGVPIFADESVRSTDDASRMLALPAVAGITVKPGRLGWRGALAVRDLANASGKLWRASGLLETAVGRAFTDHLAADETAFLSDVAPASLFLESAVAEESWGNGEVVVPTGLGLGVAPDAEAMERYLTSEPLDVDVVVSGSEDRDPD
jgi:L-alanine-DL-glutamate epimerase-like enolase superfamily enzyme